MYVIGSWINWAVHVHNCFKIFSIISPPSVIFLVTPSRPPKNEGTMDCETIIFISLFIFYFEGKMVLRPFLQLDILFPKERVPMNALEQSESVTDIDTYKLDPGSLLHRWMFCYHTWELKVYF